MKTLLTTVLSAAALIAAPALAADPPAARPAADAKTPMDMSKMSDAELHKHCAAMMGGKMQGRPVHDHAADKLGHAPAMKAPTEAEMKAMHDKCAARMAEGKTDAAPAKP